MDRGLTPPTLVDNVPFCYRFFYRKASLSDNIYLDIYTEIFTSGHITGDSLEVVGENIFGHWDRQFPPTLQKQRNRYGIHNN